MSDEEDREKRRAALGWGVTTDLPSVERMAFELAKHAVANYTREDMGRFDSGESVAGFALDIAKKIAKHESTRLKRERKKRETQ